MWQLTTILANNICTFESLSYDPLQSHATLIFGENKDNDSQNSNGSGKSALLEAIAISLTGQPLRSVKSLEELINDSCDTMNINAYLHNHETKSQLVITRHFSRKDPQKIGLTLNDEPIVCATTNDYNKWILDTLGLTRDEIFATFILSRDKYKSFLTCADKEKKEIINRFSNGNLVDESIEALQNDMVPIQEELVEAEKTVAKYEGQVKAMENEIERIKSESSERAEDKRRRIKEWQEAIAQKRSEIRGINTVIDNCENYLDKLDEAYNKIQKLEDSDESIGESYRKACVILSSVDIQIKDYSEDYTEKTRNISAIQDKQTSINRQIREITVTIDDITDKLDKEIAHAEKESAKLIDLTRQSDGKLIQFKAECNDIYAKLRLAELSCTSANLYIEKLKATLEGAVTCPKCHHSFLLENDKTVEALKAELDKQTALLESTSNERTKLKQQYDEKIGAREEERNKKEQYKSQKEKLYDKADAWEVKLRDAERKQSELLSELTDIERRIDRLEKELKSMREDMFDGIFERIDKATQAMEGKIQNSKLQISNLEGAIKSYEESISDITNISDADIIKHWEDSKKGYEDSLEIATTEAEYLNGKLTMLKTQEGQFVDFKSHLANSKIEAISAVTNEFLDLIGSDMRIALSGYTKLRTGKIRDKISVSLLRNGVDCGSFAKLSKGEQARIQLANILAMYKLTNSNCNDGKGLDLLIIDEILDASDENGLANVFSALNKMQITSLIVSHGNIAEGYQHKLIVTKENGISVLNG